MWSVRDSQVLPSGGSGLASDGSHRKAQSPHVPVQSRSTEEALDVTTSTDEMEVKMLPHMAKSSIRVLFDNSAVGAKCQLLALSINEEGLPR